MAEKYKFDGIQAKCIAVLEKDWPSTRSGLYRAQVEMKRLRAYSAKLPDLDNEGDIDDPDLKIEAFQQLQLRSPFNDSDINWATFSALVHSDQFSIPSIFPAAIYTLYVQANFRTIRRFSHGPGNVRHMMTNDLVKLAQGLPEAVTMFFPLLKKLVYIVSFWIQKKFKRQCGECKQAEKARVRKQMTGDGGAKTGIDTGPVREPLPPFIDLRVCEPDPLGNLRSETIKYFRKHRPTGGKYCLRCWSVLKKEINTWADKLWVDVLREQNFTHNYIMDVSRHYPSYRQ